MSLVTGHIVGHNNGLKTSTLSIYNTGCVPAVQLQSSAVSNSSFPIIPADVATLFGNAAATPSYIFTCQETDGLLVDAVQNEVLVPGPSFSNGITYGVATTGLEGPSRTAISFTDNSSDYFMATRRELMDPAQGSFAWLLVYRLATDTTQDSLAGKGLAINTGDPETAAGIITTVNHNGLLGASFSDGSLGVSSSLLGTAQTDNNWHIACTAFNESTGDIRTMHETVSHLRNLNTLTFISPSAQSYFSIGDDGQGHLNVSQKRYGTAPMELTYLLLFEGSAAEYLCDNPAAVGTFHGNVVT